MMRVKSVERYEEANQTVPEEVMVTFDFGRPESVPTASTRFTTSIPSTTSPKTTCLPSSHDVTTVVMKNCVTRQLLRAHPTKPGKEKHRGSPASRWYSDLHSPWRGGPACHAEG